MMVLSNVSTNVECWRPFETCDITKEKYALNASPLHMKVSCPLHHYINTKTSALFSKHIICLKKIIFWETLCLCYSVEGQQPTQKERRNIWTKMELVHCNLSFFPIFSTYKLLIGKQEAIPKYSYFPNSTDTFWLLLSQNQHLIVIKLQQEHLTLQRPTFISRRLHTCPGIYLLR